MSEKKKSKTVANLRRVLFNLKMTADRVSRKYGVIDDNGTPSDYQEWVDLRRAIQEAGYLEKESKN